MRTLGGLLLCCTLMLAGASGCDLDDTKSPSAPPSAPTPPPPAPQTPPKASQAAQHAAPHAGAVVDRS